MTDISEKMAAVFVDSSYHIIATGFRDVGYEELIEVIKILRSRSPETSLQRLEFLYENDPDTIALEKSFVENTCNRFCDECDCYLPGIEFEDYYCQRLKKEKIENTDRRNYPEYEEWRKAVFERDEYTCQECGQKGGNLNAHHINSYHDYPKERINLSNGVTLCVRCHKDFHTKKAGSNGGEK